MCRISQYILRRIFHHAFRRASRYALHRVPHRCQSAECALVLFLSASLLACPVIRLYNALCCSFGRLSSVVRMLVDSLVTISFPSVSEWVLTAMASEQTPIGAPGS
jgi:hypothetical protein